MKERVLAILCAISMVSIMCGCGSKISSIKELASSVDETKREIGIREYSDLTEEDFATIDYVNQNSNFTYEFMGEMTDATVVMDVGDLYQESNPEVDVDAYGLYISGVDGIIRTQISLKGESDSHILGVHNGDVYKDVKEKLQEDGFEFISEAPFNSNTKYITFAKGNVAILFEVSFDYDDRDNIENGNVAYVCVSVPVLR